MNDTEDNRYPPTQPRSSSGNDLEDTQPLTPVPPDLETLSASSEAVHYRSYDEGILRQDEIATPPPLAAPPEMEQPGPRRSGSSCALRLAVGLALLLGMLSLALNGVLIYGLLTARQAAIDGIDRTIAALDNLGGEGFHYEYQFSRTIPFEGDIPVQQEFVFPFKGNFPIKTTVKVPINAGVLGTIMVEVPIDTTIPVDVEVPIKIDQTIHVSTTIPVNMPIPIDIQPGDPAIQELLDKVRAWLEQLKASLMLPW